jgi:glycosyltransferase involved in cell wall biosynthesis
VKLLLVHNYYQQPGGEDHVFAAEAALLERHGHVVIRHTAHNASIGKLTRLALAQTTIWNRGSFRQVRSLIQRERPDVLHVHNTFPLLSPSIYYAAQTEGVPVVQSLHNPRLLCPSANFFRSGQLCTDCLGKTFAWPGVAHGCYHSSRLHTLGVAGMTTIHRLRGTWTAAVSAYVVFTDFYRELFIKAGLPASKIMVKPHFIWPDPGRSSDQPSYALYIGRLDPEKGVRTMIGAWRHLKRMGIELPLKVRGGGQLLRELSTIVQREGLNVEFVDRLSENELRQLIKGAHFLVWPSEGYYETFGLVAIESFACGVPVIASRIGVATSNVTHRRTGLHFTPGDADDLADKVAWAVAHPAELEDMGRKARAEYLDKYTAERNYRQLIEVYERALGR